MDRCTHEVRTQYWKGIVQNCSQRPAGQTAKSWLDENGISEQSYYHWQRKLRQQTYDLVKEKAVAGLITPNEAEVSFVELPCTVIDQENIKDISCPPVAVIRTSAMSIEITNAISESLLTRILKEVTNA